MSFLKNFEQKIENLIEGVFKNKFSAQIQPIELAKHVINVMEDQKKVGADETIVPANFEILVNSVDFSELKPFLSEYEDVISRYVSNQCERRSYTLKGRLTIKFAVDDDLGIGFFQIIIISGTPLVPQAPVGNEPPLDYKEERKSIFKNANSPGAEPASAPVPTKFAYEERPENANFVDELARPGKPLKEVAAVAASGAAEPQLFPDEMPSSDATRIFDTKESEQLIALTAKVAPRPRTKRYFLLRSSDGAKIPLTRPVITIGRSKQNDLSIDSDSVSRKHAELLLRDGKFLLVDLGSTNGTLVNGSPITSVSLKANDIIELSTERYTFAVEEDE